VPESLRIAYTRGVTPGKWARIWGERFRHIPLGLELIRPVTEAAAQLEAAADAQLAFIRLMPGEAQPEGYHLIPLYEERPFVVAAKGNVIEAADEVSLAELEGEVRHPFDDDIESTIEVVAASVGVVVVPQSIARLYARKDVIARPVTDAHAWRVGLAWRTDAPAEVQPRIDDFIGVVRGRTANSSRGEAGGAVKKATPATSGGDRRPKRPAPGRSRGGRSGRRPTR